MEMTPEDFQRLVGLTVFVVVPISILAAMIYSITRPATPPSPFMLAQNFAQEMYRVGPLISRQAFERDQRRHDKRIYKLLVSEFEKALELLPAQQRSVPPRSAVLSVEAALERYLSRLPDAKGENRIVDARCFYSETFGRYHKFSDRGTGYVEAVCLTEERRAVLSRGEEHTDHEFLALVERQVAELCDALSALDPLKAEVHDLVESFVQGLTSEEDFWRARAECRAFLNRSNVSESSRRFKLAEKFFDIRFYVYFRPAGSDDDGLQDVDIIKHEIMVKPVEK